MRVKDKSNRTFAWSTFEQLEQDILDNWACLVGRRFDLQLANTDDSDTFSDILRLQQDKTLYLKEIRREFIKMSDDPNQINVIALEFPFPLLQDVKLTAEVKTVFKQIQRLILYCDRSESVGYTMREFITAMLLGALALHDAFKLKMKDRWGLVCKKKISGRLG